MASVLLLIFVLVVANVCIVMSKGDFEQEILKLHNKYRKVHNAPPMTLSQHMSEQAASYARKIASMGILKHSTREERDGNGENLFNGCFFSVTSDDVVTSWYKEVCHYDFDSHESTNGKLVAHFTQVVWKESLELGIGKATGKNSCTYVVARYNPPGNWSRKHKKNVLKGVFDKSFCNKRI